VSSRKGVAGSPPPPAPFDFTSSGPGRRPGTLRRGGVQPVLVVRAGPHDVCLPGPVRVLDPHVQFAREPGRRPTLRPRSVGGPVDLVAHDSMIHRDPRPREWLDRTPDTPRCERRTWPGSSTPHQRARCPQVTATRERRCPGRDVGGSNRCLDASENLRGEAGLWDRSSRPYSCPTRTSEQVGQAVLKFGLRASFGLACEHALIGLLIFVELDLVAAGDRLLVHRLNDERRSRILRLNADWREAVSPWPAQKRSSTR